MRFIEIDGERVVVYGCRDCPCYDEGYLGYEASCKHPFNSEVTKHGRHGTSLDDAECPLRELREVE